MVDSYTNITMEQLAALLQDKSFSLINVPIPNVGKIPQTDAEIPYNKIEKHLDGLPDCRSSPIVLYCKGDVMCEEDIQAILEMGYNNLFILDGGGLAWQEADNPFERVSDQDESDSTQLYTSNEMWVGK